MPPRRRLVDEALLLLLRIDLHPDPFENPWCDISRRRRPGSPQPQNTFAGRDRHPTPVRSQVSDGARTCKGDDRRALYPCTPAVELLVWWSAGGGWWARTLRWTSRGL